VIALLLFTILLPLAASFLLAGLWGPGPHPFRSYLMLKISLAVGLALGLSSCMYFVWLLMGGTSRVGLIVSECVIFGIAIGCLALIMKKRGSIARTGSSLESSRDSHRHWATTALAICAAVALVTALSRFVFLSLMQPHGEVDALTIWNLRARFLAGGGEQWRESLVNLLASRAPDYPLLLPASIARWWTYLGDHSTIVPALVAMLFTLATIGLTASSLSMLRSTNQGLLAGIVLLGTPFFIKHGASQYADVPLGFFMLATLVAFSLAETEVGNKDGIFVIAGLTAGFAAWTKNEGLLFVCAIVLVRCLVVVPAKGWKAYGNEMRPFAIGLVPVLMVVGFFKTQIAPGVSPILAEQGAATTLERLTDTSRYLDAGQAFLKKAVRFGHPGFIVLLGYWLLMGRHVSGADRSGIRTAAMTLGVMLAGYFMIFIVTPHGLSYQVATSLDRLWIQLWPSAAFLFFLVVRTPDEVMATWNLASAGR